MWSDATTHNTFAGPLPVRERVSVWSAASSLLATLILVLALILPATFLAGQNAADALSTETQNLILVPGGKGQVSSAAQPDGGKGGHSTPSQDENSPGGLLEPTEESSKTFGLIGLLVGFKLWADSAKSKRKPSLIEAEFENDTLPPQLLRRPPPHK